MNWTKYMYALKGAILINEQIFEKLDLWSPDHFYPISVMKSGIDLAQKRPKIEVNILAVGRSGPYLIVLFSNPVEQKL